MSARLPNELRIVISLFSCRVKVHTRYSLVVHKVRSSSRCKVFLRWSGLSPSLKAHLGRGLLCGCDWIDILSVRGVLFLIFAFSRCALGFRRATCCSRRCGGVCAGDGRGRVRRNGGGEVRVVGRRNVVVKRPFQRVGCRRGGRRAGS